MGCTSCKSKVGCDDRKGTMMATVDRVLADLYPTRTWGEVQSTGGGLPRDELFALADELATELRAATFVREGDDDQPCDFIYVLCVGRAPCIVQVRDHGVPVPEEWNGGGTISELYLRVVASQHARIAGVQQVAIELADGVAIERPRAGVYDAPLLARMQRLVAILPAYDLLHVDFGEIAHAPPGYIAGAWRSLYAGDPAIANYLFYPQPATMVVTASLR
jgi:hypothetical protein